MPHGTGWARRLLCYLFLVLCIYQSVVFLRQRDLKAYIDFSNIQNRVIGRGATHDIANETVDDAAPPPTIHPYAYAFLVAGCDPDDPRYLGFLYNILVGVYSLWSSGSKAEVVVMIQMAANTKHHVLPAHDTELFSKFTNNTIVQIQYLPKPKLDSFYQAMMSKFAVLNLTKYSRVLFMDADVMPLCNLDYLFNLSEQGILKENIVMATRSEPANGGFFMLRPDAADYQLLLSILKRQHERAIQNSSYPFDCTLGWGHTIEPPDEWVALGPAGNRGRVWFFHGYFADQGLLYHWVKYVKRNVSILIHDRVQNWVSPSPLQPLANGTAKNITNPVMEFTTYTVNLPGFGCPIRYPFLPKRRPPPFKDFIHFSGNTKPWERGDVPDDIDDPIHAKDQTTLWFHWLRRANQEFQLNLNITSILNRRRPSLGRYPILQDMVAIARADANIT